MRASASRLIKAAADWIGFVCLTAWLFVIGIAVGIAALVIVLAAMVAFPPLAAYDTLFGRES